jgi:hypothetical protein
VSTLEEREGCCVSEDGAVDDVAVASFEAAQRFSVALSGGSFGLVVGATLGVLGDLGDGHDV